jgi:hypothetical protein
MITKQHATLVSMRNYQRELLRLLIEAGEGEKPRYIAKMAACENKLKIFLRRPYRVE